MEQQGAEGQVGLDEVRLVGDGLPEGALRLVDPVQADQDAGARHPGLPVARRHREDPVVVVQGVAVTVEPSEDPGAFLAGFQIVGLGLEEARVRDERLVEPTGSRVGACLVEGGGLPGGGTRRREPDGEGQERDQPGAARAAEGRARHGARSSRTGGSSRTRPGTSRPSPIRAGA